MEIKSKIKKSIILSLSIIFFLLFPVVGKAEKDFVNNLNILSTHVLDENILDNIRGGERRSALQFVNSGRIILWDEDLKVDSNQLEILTGSNNVSVFKIIVFSK
ncbi:hypothetical protein DRN73_09235 [Candidatus Pacearchaeota archaeon]|nr:MAG: hypothetical protein DRN73_09235 [Candidatus Pacearchaeota archaeon]